MELRRAGHIAACVLAIAAAPAAAQAPWPQPQQQAAPSPWTAPQQQAAPSGWGGAQPAPQQQMGASPWAAQQQGPPPCVQAFLKLRDEAQKKAEAIRAASEHHAAPQEACGLFNNFAAAEEKLIKYAIANGASCGIPPDVPANLKKGHARTIEIRGKVCKLASQPMPQAAPSLSDALSAPVPDRKNIKAGGGTFDTLSGTALGRQQ